MGEAIISRAGGGSGSSGGKKWALKTELITQNTIWNVPEAKNNEFSVRIFGGGGSGGFKGNDSNFNYYFGGGSGWMNNAVLSLNQGSQIIINIGTGGSTYEYFGYRQGQSGGTTIFGNYLSANGGNGGDATSFRGGDGSSGGGAYAYAKK